MKKIILGIILIIQVHCTYAQLTDSEKKYIDSLLITGKLNSLQIALLQKEWKAQNYPELSVNNRTGEVEISDILSFPDLEKKIIYQRCLEWIAINYGELTHSDLESGKIIANGLLDLDCFVEYSSGFDSKRIRQEQTPTNYTLILTIKGNKIKYMITNIIYNFTVLSEITTQVSYPISAIFPAKINGPQWIRNYTLLNASVDKFNISLKNSLSDYIKDFESDYLF
jgi:hypothetical protein